MKKNKMMRLASVLLVAVLMTTSVISGTFAKYVTSDNAEDSARVAKFGVVVAANGSLFDDTYYDNITAADDNKDKPSADVVAGISVDSRTNGGDVVAPGTKSSDNGISFSVTGTPEVDVKLDVVVTNNTEDVFLLGGFYDKVTTGNATDKVEISGTYQPVKYTLWQDKGNDGTFAVVTDAENVDLATLSTKLAGLSNTRFAANTDLEDEVGTFKITWKWDIGVNDDADTILGDLAANASSVKKYTALGDTGAGTALTDGVDFNLQTGLTVTVTVTQVD